MRYYRARAAALLCAALILITGGTPRTGFAAQGLPPLLAYSQGVFQPDGSVLYSVLLASGAQSLGGLTVTALVPPGAMETAPGVTPAAARPMTEDTARDVFTWQVDSLAASTVLGPFTYRVTFPANVSEPPAGVEARITWNAPAAGIAAANFPAEPLRPLVEKARVTLSASGIAEPFVGEGGISVSAPERAVSAPVTITFTRVAIGEQSLPQNVTDVWWCALYKVETDLPLVLAKPITLGLPTRQVVTPGMKVVLFTRGGADWQMQDSTFGVVMNALGNQALVSVSGQLPTYLLVGIPNAERNRATMPIGSLADLTGWR